MEEQDLRKIFGEVLRRARERTGLSQERFALQAGLDRTSISTLERGIHQPTLNTLFVLAENLGIKPATLIARVDMERRKRSKTKTPEAGTP